MSTIIIKSLPPTFTINAIAPEILHQILLALNPPETSNSSNSSYHSSGDEAYIRDIGACRLTCKYLHSVATPLLFYKVSFGWLSTRPQRSFERRISGFLEILEVNPGIVNQVQMLCLFSSAERDVDRVPRKTSGGDACHQNMKRRLWNNTELPVLISRLTSLRQFTFQVQHDPGFNWNQLCDETRNAIVGLISLPSMVSLEYTGTTGVPLKLVSSDSLHPLYLISNGANSRLTVSTTPMSPAIARSKWRIRSLDVHGVCNGLHTLLPMVEERLLWMGCNPTDISALLRRSRATLRDLTVHLRLEDISEGESDECTSGSGSNLRLDQFKSLKTLRLSIHESPTPLFIGGLVSFLHAQFKAPSPSITHLRIHASHLEDFDFVNALFARPMEWHVLENTVLTSFPRLKILELELDEMKGSGGTQWAQVFTKRVLPVITEMVSVKTILRIGRSRSTNGIQEEVDMTGFNVDIPTYLWDMFRVRIPDDWV